MFKKITSHFFKQKDLAIIICTEKGELEKYSQLLVASLRKYGGKYKDLPVFSFEPRKYRQISEETKMFFEHNNVIHNSVEINKKYANYPLANKPLVCAFAESTLNFKNLLFLDSDVVFINEPSFFSEITSSDVALRPVDSKNIGSYGPKDKNDIYWVKLYDALNIEYPVKRVRSTVDDQEILPYYNSGHIFTERNIGLFSRWKDNFEYIMSKEILPDHGIFFVEQSVFAATVVQMRLSVQQFPTAYNYPVHMQDRKMPERTRLNKVTESITIHYHKLFNNGLSEAHELFLKGSEQGQWLLSKIKSLNFGEN